MSVLQNIVMGLNNVTIILWINRIDQVDNRLLEQTSTCQRNGKQSLVDKFWTPFHMEVWAEPSS